MIRISIIYPNTEGRKFDMEYYCNSHIPLIQKRAGAACKGATVDQGLSGAAPESKAAFIAMGHLLFDSAEALQEHFLPYAGEFMADIPNYTDIEPIIQISQVKI